jgi:alanine racemase
VIGMRDARIDVGAISRNVAAIRAAAGDPRAMVIVKANGYGHGAVASARAALEGGAEWLGVADLTEALELRNADITAPVLAWIHDPSTDFDYAVARDIDLGVNYLDQLERVAAAEGVPNVQLKLDTGLSRNGVVESEWERVFERAAELERAGSLRVRGIFSHLSSAGDDVDSAHTERFARAIDMAAAAGLEPELVHLSATGGTINHTGAGLSLVRIGVGAYGLSPFGAGEPQPVTLTPAMELSASIVSVKRVPVGEGVSYGHEHVTERETTLALVPLGYADGIPRHASNRARVTIDGTSYPVRGRIAMDQFVVDVGDDAVAVGQRAVVFGDPAIGVPSADDWAEYAGTINYEIVTRIGARVIRRYVR